MASRTPVSHSASSSPVRASNGSSLPDGSSDSQLLCFAAFELDRRAGELRKGATRIKLEGQPIQVLSVLLEQPGQLVTREELKQRLWPADTFVDFEHSINSSVMRLRQALDDSAETPRFIETLPRRGYRFIYPLNGAAAEVPPAPTVARRHGRWVAALLLIALPALLAGLLAINFAGLRERLAAYGAVPPITSLAVLPLENLTGDPNQEYLVDGIHDELVTQVAQISSLKVISRTSVLHYKQTKQSLGEIARELGVDAIVEGAVQRNGDRLHVSAQLIYAPNDRHLWARSYERALGDIPALPAEIAASLAQDLHLRVTPLERARMGNVRTVDPEVYKLYLKGSYHGQKWTNEGLTKAVGFYRQALDLDPTYAPAWAGMGSAYQYLGTFAKGKDLSPEDARSQAKAALERAVALDPSLRGPHQSLAAIKRDEDDFEGSAREWELARRLDPKWLGPTTYLTNTGRFDEAVAAIRQGAERDPLAYSVQLVHGWTLFMASRYDESLAQLKKTVQLDSNIHHAHYELAWNYAKKGMYADAIRECDTANELLHRKQPEKRVEECGWVYATAGHRAQALEIARILERKEHKKASLLVARIYDALGDRERALTLLKRGAGTGATPLRADPIFSDAIKADPRFQELARQERGYPPPFGALTEVRGSAPPPAPTQRRP